MNPFKVFAKSVATFIALMPVYYLLAISFPQKTVEWSSHGDRPEAGLLDHSTSRRSDVAKRRWLMEGRPEQLRAQWAEEFRQKEQARVDAMRAQMKQKAEKNTEE